MVCCRGRMFSTKERANLETSGRDKMFFLKLASKSVLMERIKVFTRWYEMTILMGIIWQWLIRRMSYCNFYFKNVFFATAWALGNIFISVKIEIYLSSPSKWIQFKRRWGIKCRNKKGKNYKGVYHKLLCK